MPTYDYTCDACDHKWDEYQSIKAAPTKTCPECGKKKARRLISPGGGFLFKGSGFYITDYRSESYKKSAAADSKNASGGDGKSEAAKSETKSSSESSNKSTTKASSQS